MAHHDIVVIGNADMRERVRNLKRGRVTVFACPECGGSLWHVDEEKVMQFRCHVGHAFHAETLLEDQAGALETALWMAIRIFKERHLLAHQLEEQESRRGNADAAARPGTGRPGQTLGRGHSAIYSQQSAAARKRRGTRFPSGGLTLPVQEDNNGLLATLKRGIARTKSTTECVS